MIFSHNPYITAKWPHIRDKIQLNHGVNTIHTSISITIQILLVELATISEPFPPHIL
jgi:hypothetical protein